MSDVIDKAKWQLKSASIVYCLQNGLEEVPFDKHEVVWQCASNHICHFVNWLYNNDFLELKREVTNFDCYEYVKNELDYTLLEEDLKPSIVDFVMDYYDKYIDDYGEFLDSENKTMLGITFEKSDYDKLSKVIDKAYKKYLEK